MLRLCPLMACALLGAAPGAALNMSDWMGELRPVIQNLTLLDLSVPGTHDTMTYDLSKRISDRANDIPEALAAFLHDVGPLLPDVEGFVREQAVTQSADIVAQLDGGVRFIDFRIIYTKGPNLFERADWYNLHLVESNGPCLAPLKAVRAWLDQHPSEILTFWVTRHGSGCKHDQFPDIPDEDMRAFFDAVLDVFDGVMWDTAVSTPNATTVGELLARNHRVLMYVGEGARFYGNKTVAYDGCLVDNRLGGAGPENAKNAIDEFAGAQGVIDADKKAGRYYLKSMAESPPGEQMGADVMEQLLGYAGEIKKCAAAYHIPNMTDWCPPSLISSERLMNYYNQLALETTARASARGGAARFPNAIYIDALLANSSGAIQTSETSLATAYAYAPTVVATNVWRACGGASGTAFPECAGLSAALEALRAAYPFQQWVDPTHGRLVGWPLPLV